MQYKLSKVVSQSAPSPIRVMFNAALNYDDVISLGIGEPDFHTPGPVCDAALKDAKAGHTHYTSSQGDPELREALVEYLNPRYGGGLDIGNMQVTVGGMGALVAIFKTICDPGDEIIVPEPYFPAYKAMIAFAGGSLAAVQTRFEDGFVFRPGEMEKAVTPRTKAILLNSPNNPSGAVIPPEVLDEVARIAVERDLLIISDEVYDRVVFDGLEHDSIYNRPGMAERTLVIGSSSKTFAMTGWRLGWVFGPKELIEVMVKVATFYTSCPPSVSQRAALAAIRQPESTWQKMTDAFQHRRDMAYEALNAIDGISVNLPKGTFYIFPSLAGLTDDPLQFALDFLEQEQVVVIPGEGFGSSGKACIRMACTVSEAVLERALNKFTRFCQRRSG